MPPVHTPPVHTPYDGSARPFTIGLRPLDLGDWLEVDSGLESYLAEKDRLLAERRDDIFVYEATSISAQQEVLDLVLAHLTARFPGLYRRDGSLVHVGGHGRTVRLDAGEPPLLTAARLVQEDLVLMSGAAEGWRLVAGSVSFPSSWSLKEKFGRSMSAVHKPVPGFGPGTRNAVLIDRIFDRMLVEQPVWRANWSIYADPDLYHAVSASERGDHLGEGRISGRPYIRVERQTLRKLPKSGDILFTIRIHVDPWDALQRHPERRRIAAAFRDQLHAMKAEELAFKGLRNDRDRLVAMLESLRPHK